MLRNDWEKHRFMNVLLCLRHAEEHQAVLIVRGLLGEEPRRIQLRGCGSHDGKHEAVVHTWNQRAKYVLVLQWSLTSAKTRRCHDVEQGNEWTFDSCFCWKIARISKVCQWVLGLFTCLWCLKIDSETKNKIFPLLLKGVLFWLMRRLRLTLPATFVSSCL